MNDLSIITWKFLIFWASVILWILTAKLKFLLGDAAGLSEPLPHYYIVYSADHIEAIFPFFDKYNFRGHNLVTFFLMHLPYKANFWTVSILLNSYLAFFRLKISKMCETIITFNLIIANPDVKLWPRPAASPHQQGKKTAKYYVYVMFCGKRNKRWCYNTYLSPIEFSVEGRGWLYTGYCQKQLKTFFCWLLLMHLWPQELLAFLMAMHICSNFILNMVFIRS